jgi:hypothetical protein
VNERRETRRARALAAITMGKVLGDGRPRVVQLSAADAFLALDALEAYAEEQRRVSAPGGEAPPEDALDAQADRETLAHIHELRGRIVRAWEDTP